MSNEDRLRKLLSNLGKATLRGVKKCPKCGTYNGSRGLCCKNKQCDVIFKEPGEKRKLPVDACKLITGSTAQVFSVRVCEKGPNYRGFVQLPVINAATISNNEITTLMSQPTAALCFVDHCEKNFDSSVLQCHGKEPVDNSSSSCQHVEAALKCYAEAQPLTLRNSILRSLNVCDETKQEIWLLATETSGPLVQRVSRNIMAVKCRASPKHPLGYLHFSFFATKCKDRVEHRYFCSCTSGKVVIKTTGDKSHANKRTEQAKRCVHFYACICAFASDEKLSEEFEYYINLDQAESKVPNKPTFDLPSNNADKIVGIGFDATTTDDSDMHFLIFRDDTFTVESLTGNRLDIDSINLSASILQNNNIVTDNIQVECEQSLLDESSIISQVHNLEVIDQNAIVLDGNIVRILDDQSLIDHKYNALNKSQYILNDNLGIVNGTMMSMADQEALFNGGDKLVVRTDELKLPYNNNDNNKRHNNNNHQDLYAQNNHHSSFKRKAAKVDLEVVRNNKKVKGPIVNKEQLLDTAAAGENLQVLSFNEWLASITERINQTMHFQFDGKPEPLVFHVPQRFFDCLKERISFSFGAKKKRLPNSITAFVRKDGVPLGTFTKYSWLITNILHVKSIFETAQIPLEITRSFIQNSDGTYELYKRQETDIDRFKKTGNNALIKPLELKTYLKVGNTSPNQVEPTPFIIEWIPDILPISRIGELRIKFEFGHTRNESPLRCKKPTIMSSKS